MKKIFVIIAFISLFYACGDSDSGSSDDDFIINAGNIEKFESPLIKNQSITVNGTPRTINYAIIFNKTINNTNYVGIACSDNPKSESYNLKIYYEASSITSGQYSATVIDNNGTPDTVNLTLTISQNSTYSTDDYTVYDIGVAGSIGNFTIIAVKAGS